MLKMSVFEKYPSPANYIVYRNFKDFIGNQILVEVAAKGKNPS